MATHLFSIDALGLNPSIDITNGVIKNVSVISIGGAKGHGLMIDRLTLEQVKGCSEKYKGGLKVKMNHGSGVESIVGLLQNFSINDDGKLVADLHLLKNHDDYHFLLELAQKIPDTFGLSISFSGVDESKVDGLVYARCAEIYSADIVSEPAANPTGLFEANIDKKEINNMETPNVEKEAPQDPMTCMMTRLEALEKMVAGMIPPSAPVEEKKEEPAPAPVEEKKDEELKCDNKEKEMEAIIEKAVVKALAACGTPAPVSPAPAAPVEVPAVEEKKTFRQMVDEKAKEFDGDKARALASLVKTNPNEYRAALASGELNRSL